MDKIANDEIKLKDILFVCSEYKAHLSSNRKLLIINLAVFMLIGVLFAIFSKPTYDARLTFVIENEQKQTISGISSIASQFGFDLSSPSTTFSQQNILEILKSRAVVIESLMQEKEINNEDKLLIEHYLDVNNLRDSWESNHSTLFKDQSTIFHDSICHIIWQQIIKDKLSIQMQTNEATIVNLSYESFDQEFAKLFTESLIDEMRKMYIQHNTSQSQMTLDFLKERSDSVFLELKRSEEEYAKVTDINQRIIKASGRLKELQLRREVEMLNIVYMEIIKNLEVSKISLLNQTPIFNIIDKPILPLQKNQVGLFFSVIMSGLLGSFLMSCLLIIRKLIDDNS